MQINDRSQNTRNIGILAAICFVCQVAFCPYIGIASGHPNFALILALIVSLSIGGRTAVICGFSAGLVFDLSTTGPIGLMAFLLTVMSYILGIEGRDRLGEDALLTIVPTVAATAAVSLAYNLTMLLVGQSVSVIDALVFRTLPTIILTLVCYVPFYLVNGRSRKAGGMSLGGSKGSRLNVPGK